LTKKIFDSVIVPIYNGISFLPFFWESLLPNVSSGTEIIIIDDGSDENIQDTIPKFEDGVNIRVFRNETRKGYAYAVNVGLEKAIGDYIFLLNCDLILEKNSLAALKRQVDSGRSVGIVGAKLLYPQTGSLQHFGLAFSETRKFHVFTNCAANHPLVSEIREVQAVTFALCCFSRQVLNDLGFLNTSYHNGSEDIDYSLRAVKSGYKNFVVPGAIAYHWESQSGLIRHISTPDNEARFWRDWGKEIEIDFLEYFEESIDLFVKEEINLLQAASTVIDLSKSIESVKLTELLQKKKTTPKMQIFDFTQSSNPNYYIWLPVVLPLDMVRNPGSHIFVVDEFPQLLQNQYWFSIRENFSKCDFIIDLYGNIVRTDQLKSIPMRMKPSIDVS
jgi:GT2 family glycosyltransferase